MEKIFNHKSFNDFVWTPLGVELIYRYIFAFNFTLMSQQPDIAPIICLGVIDTRGKFSAGVFDTGGKLPLVSLTPVSTIPAAN
jgi:hypothetical protein